MYIWQPAQKTYLDISDLLNQNLRVQNFFRIGQTEMKFWSYLLAYFDSHQKSKGLNGFGIDFSSFFS